MYGQNAKKERERKLLYDALKEVRDICEANMPKGQWTHYERIITKIHVVAEDALNKVDKK